MSRNLQTSIKQGKSNPNKGLYVQYGCGFSVPYGWLNFDSSPTLRFERLPIIGALYTRNRQRFPDAVRYGDVVGGLPVPSSSCAGVYASHVLEHLALDDFYKALDETMRILRPGGVFRLVVPDLEQLARCYIAAIEQQASNASHLLMRRAHLGMETRNRGIAGILRDLLGNSKHLWMWDYLSLHAALQQHGFTDVRRAEFNDSYEPMFKFVEDAGRFEWACAVEARRPSALGAATLSTVAGS
jgi:predicted SAM-dependent methyltransferase